MENQQITTPHRSPSDKVSLETLVTAVVACVRSNQISPVELLSVLSGEFKVPLKVDIDEVAKTRNSFGFAPKQPPEPLSQNTHQIAAQEVLELKDEIKKLTEELNTVYTHVSRLKQAQAKKSEQSWVLLDSFIPQTVAEICTDPQLYTLLKTVDGNILVLTQYVTDRGWEPARKAVKPGSRNRF